MKKKRNIPKHIQGTIYAQLQTIITIQSNKNLFKQVSVLFPTFKIRFKEPLTQKIVSSPNLKGENPITLYNQ